jgi:hypothetical protein
MVSLDEEPCWKCEGLGRSLWTRNNQVKAQNVPGDIVGQKRCFRRS